MIFVKRNKTSAVIATSHSYYDGSDGDKLDIIFLNGRFRASSAR